MPELRKLKGRMREKGVTGIQLAAMIGREKNMFMPSATARSARG